MDRRPLSHTSYSGVHSPGINDSPAESVNRHCRNRPYVLWLYRVSTDFGTKLGATRVSSLPGFRVVPYSRRVEVSRMHRIANVFCLGPAVQFGAPGRCGPSRLANCVLLGGWGRLRACVRLVLRVEQTLPGDSPGSPCVAVWRTGVMYSLGLRRTPGGSGPRIG